MENRFRRQAGVALWRQIADEIRKGLSDGLADHNGRLPGEHSLAKLYGVNRHTVRAALRALAQEGAVETRHGDGSYAVESERIVYPVRERTRFTSGIGTQASRKKGRLLRPVTVERFGVAALALGLSEDADLVRLDSVSFADETPLARSTSWFEATRFSTIGDTYAAFGSITASLSALGIEDYIRMRTEIEARHGDAEEVAALHLANGAIVLVAKALNGTVDRQPIQYSITRFAADRVSLDVSHA